MAASKNSGSLLRSSFCFLACALVLSGAVAYFQHSGATLYSGDAEAHLNIARRVVDSRTPGWGQLGTTWLPLPHLLMLPFVNNDYLWTTGLAGAVPAAICMALACSFLFAAVRRLLRSDIAAAVAALVLLVNPNSLYLGSVPMTEPAFFLALTGLLCFTVAFAESAGWGALLGAALCALAGTLTRYEGWFLLPFAATYIWARGGRRLSMAIVFCCIAGLGPLLWLTHNWWYFGDALYFYRGPWSPRAIQRGLSYPGSGDWLLALKYFFTAARWIVGWPGIVLGAAGVLAALARRLFWPVFLLLLPTVFYVWSMHSSGGTPIHVPNLEPHSWYNIRYAMVLLPLIALGAGAIASLGKYAAVPALLAIALGFFNVPITLTEAENNSRGRRDWTAQASQFLSEAAGPHETYFTSFNDMTAIYRTKGIHLRDTLTGDNDPHFNMAQSNPPMFLREDWAIAMGGDTVQGIIDRARLRGPRYELSRRFMVKDQPVIEIYHRVYENPLH